MEKDRLLFCIGRFDHYYESVNNKGNVILALSTFLVGGEITAYPFFVDNINFSIIIMILYVMTITVGLLSIIMILFATIPYMNCSRKASLLFFSDIAKISGPAFNERSKSLTNADELVDLRSQTHDLAKGLRNKFIKLRIAGSLLILQLALLIPFIILTFRNLN